MIRKILEEYLHDLAEVRERGDAREESYYPALKKMLTSLSEESGHAGVSVTVLPSRTEGGNPDARVWDGSQRVTGYVEAKSPGTNLNEIEESEQLLRYRHTWPNIILTDFCEYRLYRDGDLVLRSELSDSSQLNQGVSSTSLKEVEETEELLDTFFSFSIPVDYSAESLARSLAKRTRLLRGVVGDLVEEEEPDLMGFYGAFKEYLITDLKKKEFSDLYSQTITYGLFAARLQTENNFTRENAADMIPDSLGILHEIFDYISYGEIPEPLKWMVDDIAEVLAVAEPEGILDDYYGEGDRSDPVVHFYETFLAEYDPETREERGVYYTPEPVVSYIVRSIHQVLKEKFNELDGMASQDVRLLDPAAGTMTFLSEATQISVDEYTEKYHEEGVYDHLREHILENFYAFELMMAPYAVGHLKISYLLKDMGYPLNELIEEGSDATRIQLYLTNTLDFEESQQAALPGLRSLSEEANKADKVKKETPILAILGNPPYSGHSANQKLFSELIEDYKQVDGEPLNEKNPKWLHDDYVKFLRFSEWKIASSGHGVVGMITNHSWLDNPTFRGMRWHLLQTYDEIWILDLHGNIRKQETTPEGNEDDNVFDNIRQGVAISIFVKTPEGSDGLASVFHADLWGAREDKYNWLGENRIDRTEWEEVTPKGKFYIFKPRNEENLDQYNEFPNVKEIFPTNSVGVVTSRDSFVIDFSKERLKEKIQEFRSPSTSDAKIRETYGLSDTNEWNMEEARKEVQRDDKWEDKITKILYRPFDERYLFYHPALVERDRREVMQHMLAGDNNGLVSMRQVSLDESYTHSLSTEFLVDNRVFKSSKGIAQIFPLYLYPSFSDNSLFGDLSDSLDRKPNINERIFSQITNCYDESLAPEDIFDYIYAILYTPRYREKYGESLRIDFPRIPFTSDFDIFSHISQLGNQLRNLHMLNSEDIDPPIAQFQGSGNNEIARRKSQGFRYDPEQNRKYINENQYFSPVPKELWNYQVGGYQVLHKWLKDRKDRQLSTSEIRTYCRIVTALEKTIETQEKIDAIYPKAEDDTININLSD